MADQSITRVEAEKPYFWNAFAVSAGTKLPSAFAPKEPLLDGLMACLGVWLFGLTGMSLSVLGLVAAGL